MSEKLPKYPAPHEDLRTLIVELSLKKFGLHLPPNNIGIYILHLSRVELYFQAFSKLDASVSDFFSLESFSSKIEKGSGLALRLLAPSFFIFLPQFSQETRKKLQI